jgi:hypothetical protein
LNLLTPISRHYLGLVVVWRVVVVPPSRSISVLVFVRLDEGERIVI